MRESIRVVGTIALGLAFGAVVGVPLVVAFGFMRLVSRR